MSMATATATCDADRTNSTLDGLAAGRQRTGSVLLLQHRWVDMGDVRGKGKLHLLSSRAMLPVGSWVGLQSGVYEAKRGRRAPLCRRSCLFVISTFSPRDFLRPQRLFVHFFLAQSRSSSLIRLRRAQLRRTVLQRDQTVFNERHHHHRLFTPWFVGQGGGGVLQEAEAGPRGSIVPSIEAGPAGQHRAIDRGGPDARTERALLSLPRGQCARRALLRNRALVDVGAVRGEAEAPSSVRSQMTQWSSFVGRQSGFYAAERGRWPALGGVCVGFASVHFIFQLSLDPACFLVCFFRGSIRRPMTTGNHSPIAWDDTGARSSGAAVEGDCPRRALSRRQGAGRSEHHQGASKGHMVSMGQSPGSKLVA
jgi:hypothetical protein